MDSFEQWRLILLALVVILLGVITHQWIASLAVVSTAYAGWLVYKLHELNRWLEKGAPKDELPDSNGLWESALFKVLRMQKQSNARKKVSNQLLKRSQRIISALPYAAILLTRDNEIEWANRSAREWLNVDNKRDRGQRLENLLRIPELHKLLAKKRGAGELEIVYPPGGDRHLALQIVPIKKGPKLIIARDISERVRIQQMRRNFIANASHELRTPLTVVSGYLEMLQHDKTLPEQLKSQIESAGLQTQRMQNIIEDLLKLSKLEGSEIDSSELETIDMSALISQQCLDTTTRLGGDSHIIESDIDANLNIRGIPSEIVSVCDNLVGNAIRHTPPGTRIRIEWKKFPEGMACLSVSDNGEGIPARHLRRLTERFYRVDEARSREKGGAGLGLAIVQHIMQRHGGRLEIESAPGKGSTFRACFPSA